MDRYGAKNQTVDAKGRMAVPKEFRDDLNARGVTELVITADKNDCLLLMSKQQHEELARRINALPSSNLADALRRLYLAMSETVTFDVNGRVLLPPMLRDFAKIERKAAFLSVGKTFQIWSEATVTSALRRDQDLALQTPANEMPDLNI